jgi:hypothetical protein
MSDRLVAYVLFFVFRDSYFSVRISGQFAEKVRCLFRDDSRSL